MDMRLRYGVDTGSPIGSHNPIRLSPTSGIAIPQSTDIIGYLIGIRVVSPWRRLDSLEDTQFRGIYFSDRLNPVTNSGWSRSKGSSDGPG